MFSCPEGTTPQTVRTRFIQAATKARVRGSTTKRFHTRVTDNKIYFWWA